MSSVLLVEDNPNVSESYKGRFEKQGIQVLLAYDIEDMWDKLEKARSDKDLHGAIKVIILDIMLPETTGESVNEDGGLKVLEQLEKDYPDIKVIVNTGRGDDACKEEALKYNNVLRFFRKPSTMAMMRELKRFLGINNNLY